MQLDLSFKPGNGLVLLGWYINPNKLSSKPSVSLVNLNPDILEVIVFVHGIDLLHPDVFDLTTMKVY